jgi:CheY-like chemotaxis protein
MVVVLLVLLVEDEANEQARAKEALSALGYRVAVAGTYSDAVRLLEQLRNVLVGVVTDLHIPESSTGSEAAQDASAPRALGVVASAALTGVPAVVCSDVDHHFADYLKVVVQALERAHPLGTIPFIMDRKDWERAARELERLIIEKEKTEKKR